jgi:hypothetical protein
VEAEGSNCLKATPGIHMFFWLSPSTITPTQKNNMLRAILKQKCNEKSAHYLQKALKIGRVNWVSHSNTWVMFCQAAKTNTERTFTTNNHKCSTDVFASDLQWWVDRLSDENYCEKLWDTRPIATLFCNASQLEGGAFNLDEWLYTSWLADHPDVANSHINMMEHAIVAYAIQCWIHKLRGHRIIVYTDNMATRSILNL